MIRPNRLNPVIAGTHGAWSDWRKHYDRLVGDAKEYVDGLVRSQRIFPIPHRWGSLADMRAGAGDGPSGNLHIVSAG